MLFDASLHHGIDGIVFSGRISGPVSNLQVEPFEPLLSGFQCSLLSHLAS